MLQIKGKTLVFTDIHFGIRNNQQSRQKICVQVMKEIITYISKNNIDSCIFMGDYFHVRSQLSVDTINIAYKCIQALAKKCKVYMIVGNHDIFLKNSLDINSIKMFSDIENINIIESPTEISINGNKSILLPWLSDIQNMKHEEYDMLFGHFDVSTKFLIQSYIENNKNITSTNDKTSNVIDKSIIDKKQSKTNDLVGNFIDIAKRNGVVFSGHIHNRKEFVSKGRNFIFVGSPYQQNLGEKDNECGFYIIDENNDYSFVEIKNIPRHVEVKISRILEDIDKFDFSIFRNNIIHKIYDIEINRQDDVKISQKILDMKPYEELLPDYDVMSESESTDEFDKQTIQLLRKNKLEYIRNYIENIDDNALKQNGIEKSKLYDILEKYYNKVNKS